MSGLTFNVSLSPQLAEFVRSKVESGAYASVSEVVREALRWFAAGGASRQVPILLDVQEELIDRARAKAAIRGLRRLRKGKTLGRRLTAKSLRDEGRR